MEQLAIREYHLPISEIISVGKILAESGFFSDARGASQAVAKILAGQELGFGPMASMTGIYIVKGKVTLSANLLAAAIKRSGKYDYIIRQLDDQVCKIAFLEHQSNATIELGESAFTTEDAKQAGLLGGDNWKKYKRNMLFARAISNGQKWFCPDILGGPIYTPDELGLPVDSDGEIIEGRTMQPMGTNAKSISIKEEAEADESPNAQPPASPPQKSRGTTETKRNAPTIRTKYWADILEAVHEQTDYYNDEHGNVNPYHALNALPKAGFEDEFITDDNKDEALRLLLSYAFEQAKEQGE